MPNDLYVLMNSVVTKVGREISIKGSSNGRNDSKIYLAEHANALSRCYLLLLLN